MVSQPALAAAPVSRLHPARRAPHDLPRQPTPLLGRVPEVAALEADLRDPQVRILTLTGPGGTGKSRLAVEVAARVADDHADGVAFVDLLPVRDPQLVPAAIIRALDARDADHASPLAALVATVGERQLLLVLDNFEQVLAAAADVAGLVAACPHLSVLVTSRAPLHVRWEREVPVAPLALPGPQPAGDLDAVAHSPAVALFVQRARVVRPDFALTADNAGDVAAICGHVQGLPLAIELAAARVRILSPRTLLTRLTTAGASPTLDLLQGGPRDLPERQRSLRAAIAWSHDLLPPAERTVLRRLAVFAGGWTLDAAEAVCATVADGSGGDGGPDAPATLDVQEALLSLVEKSLVVRSIEPDGEPRFTLLEAVHEFAREQLVAAGEEEVVRHRHADHALALARSTARALAGVAQAASARRLDREHHNLRGALEWSLTGGDPVVALRLCAALTMFWYIRGHYHEGRSWSARAVAAAPDGPPATRAAVLHGAASLADIQQDRAEAQALIEASVALWRVAGRERGLAGSLSLLGMLARHQGDGALARRSCAEALDIYATAPDPWGERLALGVLGWVAEDEGDHAAAQQLLEASLAKAREGSSPTDVALQLNNLGIVALRQGDDVGAEAHHHAALVLTDEVAAHEPMAGALEGLAGVAAARRDPARAAWLLGAATGLRDAIGSPRIAQFDEEHRRLLPQVQAALAEVAFAASTAAGGDAPLDDVLAVALGRDEPAPPEQAPQPRPGPGGDRRPGSGGSDLTPRQVEYLRLLTRGSTNRAIAAALVVSETGVEQMLVRLYRRIGVRNRAEAIRFAYEQGIASPDPA